MNVILISQLLFLLALANGAPVVAKKLLGNAFAWPLDGGMLFIDGRPVFGASKTVRGLILSILTTSICAPLAGLSPSIGAAVAVGAMAGDIFSSFLKRRMARPVSSQAPGLDQIPESLAPLLAVRLPLPVTILEIAVAVTAFFLSELVLSRFLFKLHVRDRPF
jgi:CDP-2,3-bis-(O-geranylgeranyl)-sn-glycerol synthase